MQAKLEVRLLEAEAKLPVVATPGEDLGYDLFALEDVTLPLNQVVKVRTGIAVAAYAPVVIDGVFGLYEVLRRLGLLVKDRSSMALKGIVTRGGVIDAGFTGEIVVFMTNMDPLHRYFPWPGSFQTMPGYEIKAGDKIAQMIPTPVLTGEVIEVNQLQVSKRGTKGFGSSESN